MTSVTILVAAVQNEAYIVLLINDINSKARIVRMLYLPDEWMKMKQQQTYSGDD